VQRGLASLAISLLLGCASTPGDSVYVQGQTNQCTAVPDGNFGHCCDSHDTAYWFGGTERDRHLADTHLMACMLYEGAPPLVPTVYFLGVRIFGWPKYHYREHGRDSN
jgi:hypothetical protein